MNKKWIPIQHEYPKIENTLFDELMAFSKAKDASTVSAYQIFSRLLLNRNIKSVEEAIAFNSCQFENLHDPFLMLGMDKAASRVLKAINNDQKIMVYGDYDVDGTTSVALMVSFLSGFTENLIYYIPDRYTEGYGISMKGIDHAKEEKVDLIIALDCGIKAVKQIEYANSLQIDFIICDHHTPGDEIPDAIAILDPKQTQCPYPYKELSGCGIGLKLCQAIQHVQKSDFDIKSLMDFVAISIACDIVPVTGENRMMASMGLALINNNPRASLTVLFGEKDSSKTIRISDLVFQIGPKINAAGRISKGKTAVDLLLAKQKEEITGFGIRINTFNEERKEQDKRITEEALLQLESITNHEKNNSSVLYHENWHKGVVGIVASRVIEKHYKPTIILTDSDNEIIGGSVRSVKGFNVYNALEQCTDFMIQFGGHKYAAGLTLKKEQLDSFKKKFEEVVSEQMEEEKFAPSIPYENEIGLDEITLKLKSLIDKLEPFGPQNMTPTFVSKGLIDTGNSRAVGADKTHLKLELTDPKTGTIIQGIAFGLGELDAKINSGLAIDVAYTIDINNWKGKSTIQIMVKDIKFTNN